MYLDNGCAARVLGVDTSALQKGVSRHSSRYQYLAVAHAKGGASNKAYLIRVTAEQTAQAITAGRVSLTQIEGAAIKAAARLRAEGYEAEALENEARIEGATQTQSQQKGVLNDDNNHQQNTGGGAGAAGGGGQTAEPFSPRAGAPKQPRSEDQAYRGVDRAAGQPDTGDRQSIRDFDATVKTASGGLSPASNQPYPIGRSGGGSEINDQRNDHEPVTANATSLETPRLNMQSEIEAECERLLNAPCEETAEMDAVCRAIRKIRLYHLPRETDAALKTKLLDTQKLMAERQQQLRPESSLRRAAQKQPLKTQLNQGNQIAGQARNDREVRNDERVEDGLPRFARYDGRGRNDERTRNDKNAAQSSQNPNTKESNTDRNNTNTKEQKVAFGGIYSKATKAQQEIAIKKFDLVQAYKKRGVKTLDRLIAEWKSVPKYNDIKLTAANLKRWIAIFDRAKMLKGNPLDARRYARQTPQGRGGV